MKILCDQNVAHKYIAALENADNVTVTTVAAELSADASDEEIATFVERHDWTLLTSDDDFFDHAGSFGLLVYSQIADPPPGDLVAAVNAIEAAYERHSDIIETVPGNWI